MDKDNKYSYKYDKTIGYGHAVFNFETYAQMVSFNKPIDEEQILKFKENLKSSGINQSKSHLAEWKNGELNLLVGNSIPDIHKLNFDEFSK